MPLPPVPALESPPLAFWMKALPEMVRLPALRMLAPPVPPVPVAVPPTVFCISPPEMFRVPALRMPEPPMP